MNNIDVLVGKRIRARRHALGISQSELGNSIGVKFQQIQKYETGANRVSASRLWAISDKLGVPVVYFFEGISPSREGEIPEIQLDKYEFLSDSESVELMELYRQLPLAQREAVLEFMRSMVPASNVLKTRQEK